MGKFLFWIGFIMLTISMFVSSFGIDNNVEEALLFCICMFLVSIYTRLGERND